MKVKEEEIAFLKSLRSDVDRLYKIVDFMYTATACDECLRFLNCFLGEVMESLSYIIVKISDRIDEIEERIKR